TVPPEIYTLSLHDALPICRLRASFGRTPTLTVGPICFPMSCTSIPTINSSGTKRLRPTTTLLLPVCCRPTNRASSATRVKPQEMPLHPWATQPQVLPLYLWAQEIH